MVKSPITWFGGKSVVAPWIVEHLPVHQIYVEPFAGGASVLMAKEPSPVEVINDLDSGLVNFWRVLRDPGKFDEFQRLAALTPYAREEWTTFKETWQDGATEVERAHRWFVVARMSFSGKWGESWSSSVAWSRRGMSGGVSKWLSAVDALEDVCTRLMRVQVEHADFRQVMKRYDTTTSLMYVDPPYVEKTRGKHRYAHDLTDQDHIDLVALLLGLKGKAVLSGYDDIIYAPLEAAGWRRVAKDVACLSAARTKATGLQGEGSSPGRTESLWLSPGVWEEVGRP